jgi:hypothetical protein
MKPKTRVEVEFNDSNIMHGWKHPDVEDILPVARAVGYFKSEDKDQITLTMAISDASLIFEKLTIPKGAIISIKELRVK